MTQRVPVSWASSSFFSSDYDAAKLGNLDFRNAAQGRFLSDSQAAPWTVTADFGAGTPQTLTWYKVTPATSGQAPVAFTFRGSNDGSTWDVLDTRSGVTYTDLTSRTFAFTNTTAYRYYRLNVTATAGGTSGYLSIAEMEMGDGAPFSVLFDRLPADGANVTGGSYNMGVIFTPDVDGTLTHYTFQRVGTGTYTLRIYSSAGTVLASQTYSSPGAFGWHDLALTTPLAVTAGTAYMVSVETPSSFVWYSGAQTVDVEWGDLNVPTSPTFAGVSGFNHRRSAAYGSIPDISLSGRVAASVRFERATAPTGVTGAIAATAPAAVGSLVGTAPSTGTIAGTAPAAVGSLTGAVPAAETTGTLSGVAPAAVGSLTGTVVPPVGSDVLAGVAPMGVGSLDGVSRTDRAATALTYTPVGVLVVLPLVPSPELSESAPIVRVSHQMPALTLADPAYTARIDYPVVKGVVGTVHLWIGGRDVTYLRDAVTVIRRWESETPFGDTAAAFEFPQLNPWDVPGEGDLDFLYPDAPVVVGMVSPLGVVRRLWWGFLDARGNGTAGEREDYAWEAKGTLWQAAHQVREPHALLEPTDIGVLIARTLNDVMGRRWAALPETPIGITTLTRGSRDESPWDYVQTLLSEAVTDEGRQWTLSEVAQGIFRLVLKPAPTEVHATVAYGTPGVDIDLRIDESTRVDGFYARGIGPSAGGWANVFYPALELLNPPPYPNSNPAQYMNAGDTDAGTTSGTGVTDWQTRVKEIGAWATPAVSGVMSSAWVAVVDDIQRTLGVTADGSIGPQTWNATFDRGAEGIDLKPIRLPIAVKPWVLPNTYSATGVNLGPNAEHDSTRIPRMVPLDLGPGKTKAQGRALCRTLLDTYGEAAAYGTATWQFDPNETDRTTLSHLTNVKVLGHEGVDRVLQVSSKSVELETGDDGPLYVVTTRLDERARDAMAVEDLLEQRRSAQVDPSKRPGNQAKASRTVNDQRTPWDLESPCGNLRRTAVNGSTGLWSIVTVPFAEVGKLAGIRLTSTQPFAMAIFASLRITENKMAAIVGDPFASASKWRDVKDLLDEYGIIEAWGEEGNACGYSPQTESDGGAFTGRFELDTPVDYWTETPPYVSVAVWMRGGSGFISGEFLPAYEG